MIFSICFRKNNLKTQKSYFSYFWINIIGIVLLIGINASVSLSQGLQIRLERIVLNPSGIQYPIIRIEKKGNKPIENISVRGERVNIIIKPDDLIKDKGYYYWDILRTGYSIGPGVLTFKELMGANEVHGDHQVFPTIKLEVDKTEVSVGSFCKFLNNIRRDIKRSGYFLKYKGKKILSLDDDGYVEYRKGKYYPKSQRENFPIINVTWWGAAAFCNYLSDLGGKARAYNNKYEIIKGSDGYRLPTIDEWRIIATDDCVLCPFTKVKGDDKLTDREVNMNTVGPVSIYSKRFQINGFTNIKHIYGNVWEWIDSDEVAGGAYDSKLYFDSDYEDLIKSASSRNDALPSLGFRTVHRYYDERGSSDVREVAVQLMNKLSHPKVSIKAGSRRIAARKEPSIKSPIVLRLANNTEVQVTGWDVIKWRGTRKVWVRVKSDVVEQGWIPVENIKKISRGLTDCECECPPMLATKISFTSSQPRLRSSDRIIEGTVTFVNTDADVYACCVKGTVTAKDVRTNETFFEINPCFEKLQTPITYNYEFNVPEYLRTNGGRVELVTSVRANNAREERIDHYIDIPAHALPVVSFDRIGPVENITFPGVCDPKAFSNYRVPVRLSVSEVNEIMAGSKIWIKATKDVYLDQSNWNINSKFLEFNIILSPQKLISTFPITWEVSLTTDDGQNVSKSGVLNISISCDALPTDPREIPQNSLKRNILSIIIGNKNYDNGLSDVSYAQNDMKLVSDYMRNVIGNGNPQLLTELSDVKNSDLENLFGRMVGDNNADLFTQYRPLIQQYNVEEIFIYYSGHGFTIDDTIPKLLGVDTEPNHIENAYSLKVMLANLNTFCKNENLEGTVIIDACFSGLDKGGQHLLGAKSPGAKSNFNEQGNPYERLMILSASSSDQASYQYEQYKLGIFTMVLMGKIKEYLENGKTSDSDFHELLKDVRRTTSDLANSRNLKQDPTITNYKGRNLIKE